MLHPRCKLLITHIKYCLICVYFYFSEEFKEFVRSLLLSLNSSDSHAFMRGLDIFALFVSQSYRMYKVSSLVISGYYTAGDVRSQESSFNAPQPPAGLRYIRLQGIMGNDGHKVRSHSFSRSLINSWPQICAARGSLCSGESYDPKYHMYTTVR